MNRCAGYNFTHSPQMFEFPSGKGQYLSLYLGSPTQLPGNYHIHNVLLLAPVYHHNFTISSTYIEYTMQLTNIFGVTRTVTVWRIFPPLVSQSRYVIVLTVSVLIIKFLNPIRDFDTIIEQCKTCIFLPVP